MSGVRVNDRLETPPEISPSEARAQFAYWQGRLEMHLARCAELIAEAQALTGVKS